MTSQILYRVDEVAKRLGVSPFTIRSWILGRRIEFVKIGRNVRIPVSEVRRLIRHGTVKPGSGVGKPAAMA